jgi:hypothetical protein
MSKLFRIEVLLVATAYIQADSAEDARAQAEQSFAHPIEASVSDSTMFGEIPVSGADYFGDDLPSISLSPALTFYGAATDAAAAEFAARDFEEIDEEG